MHRLSAFDGLVDIIGRDFLVGPGDIQGAVIVEGLKMVAANGDRDVFHHLLGRVFGLFANPGHGPRGFIDVDHDTALEPARARAAGAA